MRNRLFHSPIFHTPTEHFEKKASWLELFYDLIYVAAFIQLGNALSKYVSIQGFLAFSAMFVPLWTVWTGFTYYSNRYNVDDFLHRSIVLIQMFSVGAMAVTVPNVLDNDPNAFAVACGVAQLLIGVLYFRGYLQQPVGKIYSLFWGLIFSGGSFFWLSSIFFNTPFNYVLWVLGIVLIFLATFSKYSRALAEQYPIDNEHLSERYGLLTIIVLGEAFVKVLSSLTDAGENFTTIGHLCLTLVLSCAIWWIYFDDVAGSHIKKKPLAPMIWLFAHLPLHLAIVSLGVAIKKAIAFDLYIPAPEKYRWLLCGTLALAFLSVSIIDTVTERRDSELSDNTRVNVRFGSGILILVLAVASSGMSALWLLIIVGIIAVSQVVFDMIMAPLEMNEKGAEAIKTIAAINKDLDQKKAINAKPRKDISEAIRKGTPNELKKDVYFFFMEGSWSLLFSSIIFLYIISNIFFAALYMIAPESVNLVRPNSFLDAFFFSVQTMSTIGYGVMTPMSDYGNIVVTIEAAFGLMGVALITGLMFAKASRPKASVLFSKPILYKIRNGKPVLEFRVGNAKGSDIIDANIKVAVLIDEYTEEGQHSRRIHDLKLVRSNTPFFALSWSVIHEITEDSPLFNVDWEHPEKVIEGILATLIGHDGTYAQTVFSRYSYYPEDIKQNVEFVDVIHQLTDGRLMIDYSKFHETVEKKLNKNQKMM